MNPSFLHRTLDVFRMLFGRRRTAKQDPRRDIVYARKTESAWVVLQDEAAAAEICRDILTRAEEFVAKHGLLRQISDVRFRTYPRVVTVGEICADTSLCLDDYMERAMFDLACVMLGNEEKPLYDIWLHNYVSNRQPFDVATFKNLRQAAGESDENLYMLVDARLWNTIVAEPEFCGLYTPLETRDSVLRGQLGYLSGAMLLTDSYRIPGMKYLPAFTGFMVRVGPALPAEPQLHVITGGLCVPYGNGKSLSFTVAYAEPAQHLSVIPCQ